jgi:hypothetical protein
MNAALIGRHYEHTISLPQLGKTLCKQISQVWKQIAFDAACGAVEAHAGFRFLMAPDLGLD